MCDHLNFVWLYLILFMFTRLLYFVCTMPETQKLAHALLQEVGGNVALDDEVMCEDHTTCVKHYVNGRSAQQIRRNAYRREWRKQTHRDGVMTNQEVENKKRREKSKKERDTETPEEKRRRCDKRNARDRKNRRIKKRKGKQSECKLLDLPARDYREGLAFSNEVKYVYSLRKTVKETVEYYHEVQALGDGQELPESANDVLHLNDLGELSRSRILK